MANQQQELRAQLAAAQRETELLRGHIQWMETSKFWKLRDVVLKLKQRLPGAKADAPGGLAQLSGQLLGAAEARLQEPAVAPVNAKETVAHLCRAALKSFLASDATLRLPVAERPKVSIILITYNRAELTLACLRSICEQFYADIEVILIDNASADDTGALLERIEGANIVRNGENRHFLAGVNQAAALATGEHLLLLNNDAQLLPGSLSRAVQVLESAEDIGAVGGKILLLDGSLQEAGSIIWRDGSCLGYGRGGDPCAPAYMFQRDVDYCSGAFLLTPRQLWQQLDGFDSDYAPAYYEETDYCVRLWEAGYRVVYDPKVAILHYEFASSKKSQDALNLQASHREIFQRKHTDWLSRQYAPGEETIQPARRRKGSRGQVLFIDDRVPHDWLGSGFPRTRAMVQVMAELGYDVTFYPTALDFKETWPSIYADVPLTVEVMYDEAYGLQGLEKFLKERQGCYDAILVSRPHNMERFASLWRRYRSRYGDVKLIYDAEALCALREIKQREILGEPLPEAKAAAKVAAEIALTRDADGILTVSETERRHFQDHCAVPIGVLSHLVPVDLTPKPFAERRDLLFVGALHSDNTPNADSVVWFVKAVLPRLQALLTEPVRLRVAGMNRSPQVAALASDSVQLLGRVEDLDALYNDCRLFVAPTRYAAGIPLKVCEAAGRGIPVVATALIATQLGWTPEQELLAADDPAELARHCQRLYTDGELWQQLRASAAERVAQQCGEAAFRDSLRQILG